jgi:hypothetical protein
MVCVLAETAGYRDADNAYLSIIINKGGWKRMIVYGPVPSRRLGQSVGINNIPLKLLKTYLERKLSVSQEMKKKKDFS